MATIYIDTTEARPDTKLPNTESYISVSNLESLTGADILVSPWDDLPAPLRVDFPPHRVILHRHCWHGCLIQRKSGNDLLSSIPKLDEIVCRMQEWCQNPWLLYTCIRQTKGGMASVIGSRRRSRWYWKSIQAKLNAWQDRGGSVWGLDSDDDIPDWLESRKVAVDKWQVEPEKQVAKSPQQPIHIEDPNWYNTLRIFPPGVGDKTVEGLTRYVAEKACLPPTAWVTMQFACSPESTQVHGWGKTRMMATREWTGCDGSIYYDGNLYQLGDVAIADLVVMKERGK